MQTTTSADELVGTLYRAHALRLVRVAVLLVGDQPSAEDVVQDAFMGLYRGLPGLRDRDKALSPDGRSLYTCQQILSATTGLGGITYATGSVASQRQRVIARWSRLAAPVCAAGLDSSGRYLLIEVPGTRPINAGHLVVVDLKTGRYTNLWPPGFVTSDIPGGGTVAW